MGVRIAKMGVRIAKAGVRVAKAGVRVAKAGVSLAIPIIIVYLIDFKLKKSKAFRVLKEAFLSASILKYFNLNLKI